MRNDDLRRMTRQELLEVARRLDIKGFDQAEAPMREFIGERKEHRVSRYELPEKLKRKVIDRLKPYIDRFGYRAAVERKPETVAKAPAREREPS